MPPALAVAAVVTLANLLIMGGEAILSAFNEQVLRARGAVEPAGDHVGVADGLDLLEAAPFDEEVERREDRIEHLDEFFGSGDP